MFVLVGSSETIIPYTRGRHNSHFSVSEPGFKQFRYGPGNGSDKNSLQKNVCSPECLLDSYLWTDLLGAQTHTRWRTVQPSRAWWANWRGVPSPELSFVKKKLHKTVRHRKRLLMWVMTRSSGWLEVLPSSSVPALTQSLCSNLGARALLSPCDGSCKDGWAEETKGGRGKRGMRDFEPVEFWLESFLLHAVPTVARLKKLLCGI